MTKQNDEQIEIKYSPAVQELPEINNFEELKTKLLKGLDKYKNLVFTDEKIQEAKETRATLNKLLTVVDEKRKEIKRQYLEPYNKEEQKYKELTTLIKEPINTIDTQIKTYDQKQKSDKRKDIEEFYNVSIGDLKSILPIEKIFNEKWLNATTKINTVFDEIIKTVGKVNGDLKVINDLKLSPEFELQVKDVYLKTLDISAALQEKNRLEELQRQIKEVEEIQAVEEPQAEAQPEPQQEPEPIIEKEQVAPIEEAIPIVQDKIYYREFFVKGTKSQLIALSDFMKKNNIEYGGIEQCQSKIA